MNTRHLGEEQAMKEESDLKTISIVTKGSTEEVKVNPNIEDQQSTDTTDRKKLFKKSFEKGEKYELDDDMSE